MTIWVVLLLAFRLEPALAQEPFVYKKAGYGVEIPAGWHVATDAAGLARKDPLTLRTTTERAGPAALPQGAAEISIEVLPGTETAARVTDREHQNLVSHLREKEAPSLKRRTTVIAGRTVEEVSRDYFPFLGAIGPPEALTWMEKCTDAAVTVDGRVFVVRLIDHDYPGARGALETVIATLKGLQMIPQLSPIVSVWTAPLYDGSACCGDCNGNQATTVDELVYAMNRVLSPVFDGDPGACPAGDADENGGIFVNDLVLSVNSLFSGCPAP
jgi:hypothetical protein